MNGTIIKDADNSVIYINNIGERFMLTEAMSPLGPARAKESYDIVVGFKLRAYDGYEFADCDAPIKWFMGAGFIDDYFDANSSCHDLAAADLLESCRNNFDV